MLQRNLTRDLVRPLTRGLVGGFTPAVSYEFTLANDSLTWVSDETVAIAVYGITIPEDVPSGYKVYGEASLNADMSAPFDTELEAISETDLGDLQIDDFAFGTFAAYDGQTIYTQVWLLDDLGDDPVGNQASNKSNIVSKTLDFGGTPTFYIYGF